MAVRLPDIDPDAGPSGRADVSQPAVGRSRKDGGGTLLAVALCEGAMS